jgi:isoleucyl-tRNA synthetase
MWQVAEAMVRWLAPILSFTAEEIWGYLPGERAESVFLSTWQELPMLAEAKSAGATGAAPTGATQASAAPASAGPSGAPAIAWDQLIALRGDVARELEALRTAGTIGAPLDAAVKVYCAPAQYAALSALGNELRFLLITSEAEVVQVEPGAAAPAGAVPAASFADGGVWLQVGVASGAKCVRCWNHRPDVGHSKAHPEICERCEGNITGHGETRRFA